MKFLLPLVLCLLTLIPQTNSDRTVALIFGPDPTQRVVISKMQAEFIYGEITGAQKHRQLDAHETRLLAALVIALGTVPNDCDEGQCRAGLCLCDVPEPLQGSNQ